MAAATAMTECTIAKLEKPVVVKVLQDEPAFSELFIAYLLARNVRMESDLVDQLFNSSEKRLARLLLLLANFGKEGKPEPMVAKISQETLADMIGTNSIPRQLFHEQVSPPRIHRLQRRRPVREQRFAERGPTRLTASPPPGPQPVINQLIMGRCPKTRSPSAMYPPERSSCACSMTSHKPFLRSMPHKGPLVRR